MSCVLLLAAYIDLLLATAHQVVRHRLLLSSASISTATQPSFDFGQSVIVLRRSLQSAQAMAAETAIQAAAEGEES